MLKKLSLYAFRLLLLNIVSMIVSLFVMTPLASIWDHPVYQWFVTLVFTFLLLLLVWLDATNAGVKDIKSDKIAKKNMQESSNEPRQQPKFSYRKWFGFAGGLLAQAIAYALIALLAYAIQATRILENFLADNNWSTIFASALKLWNLTYWSAYQTFENALPVLFILFVAIFTLVSGFGYWNGPVQQRRLETIIERNKAKKAKRVQDDMKNKKSQQRKATKR